VTRRAPLIVLVLLTFAVGCGLPAFDFSDYRSKAVSTVEETISEARTAMLAAELLRRDRTFAASAIVQLEDAEEAASGAVWDLAAVLPPDARSIGLRQQLQPSLDGSADLIARMRFAARHGDLEELGRLAQALKQPIGRLEGWVEATG